MSRNLLKRNFTCLQQDDKRVINANELMAKRIEELAAKVRQPDEDGFLAGLNPEQVEAMTAEGSDGGNVIHVNAMEEARKIIADAKREAEELLADAQRQADGIKQETGVLLQHERDQVLSQAKMEGYQQGLEKAKRENKRMEEEWKQKKNELDAAYQKEIDELEPKFIDTLTGIYQHIFNVQFDSYRGVLTYLISTTMRKIDGNRDFMIHVSKEDYPYVSMQKKLLISNTTGANSTVEIVEDMSLGKNECMIETEGGIFDCGLGTQLTELRQKLKLLSYEK